MNSTEVSEAGKENKTSLFDDILIEILSRLPISSLLRFKFVCKLWFSHITNDPILAKLHFDRWFKSTGPSIIICSERRQLILMDDEGGHKHIVFSADEPFQGISPSCNGVFCIYREKITAAVLINPTTREELVLPKPSDSHIFSEFFLGYLPATDKYKLFRFYYLPTLCDVLTVGTSSWRQITFNCIATSVGNSITNGGVVINGFMYWIASSCETKTLEILSLDLNQESFGTINFPKLLRDWDLLSEVEGQLCVAQVRMESVEIWIRENSTSHAWVKRHSVWFPCPFDLPILINKGKILVRSYDGLHYRDLETGRENLGKIYDDKKRYRYKAKLHVESLVRLKAL